MNIIVTHQKATTKIKTAKVHFNPKLPNIVLTNIYSYRVVDKIQFLLQVFNNCTTISNCRLMRVNLSKPNIVSVYESDLIDLIVYILTYASKGHYSTVYDIVHHTLSGVFLSGCTNTL